MEKRSHPNALLQWTGLLARATEFRLSHEYLVYALPVADLAIGLFYERLPRSGDADDRSRPVPLRGDRDSLPLQSHDDEDAPEGPAP